VQSKITTSCKAQITTSCKAKKLIIKFIILKALKISPHYYTHQLMSLSKTGTSYQYDDFVKYKECNNLLPQHLVQYCVQDTNEFSPNIDNFSDSMRDIITSITKGDNPNNLIFRNLIKSYINTINQSNYPEYLQKLKNLEFSSQESIHFLCNELIICAIRFPSAVQGFTFQEDPKIKSIPEICVDIAKQFSSFEIHIGDKKISFHEELTKICQRYFSDFVDLNKAMDEHNENTSDNYRGFMTFMGLLYTKGIINIKVVISVPVISVSIIPRINVLITRKN
jgi:hypothetical protein